MNMDMPNMSNMLNRSDYLDKYSGLTAQDIKHMSMEETMNMNMHKYSGMSDEEIMADIASEGDTNVFRVWYMKTLPGRSGNFLAHLIPATFFTLMAMFMLLLALKRSRNLPRGKSFHQMHIPERDPSILKQAGIVAMACSGAGIFFEGFGGWYQTGNPFFQLAHLTLYFGFWVVGLCGYLEFKGRLPPDSHRGALVIALIGSYLMWHSHGVMKLLKVDQKLHILLSYINLSNAFVVAYSMRFTDSVIAFVAGWALLVLQAMWILTAGAYESIINLPGHEIETYLALQTVIVTLGVIIAVAVWGPGTSDQDNPSYRGDFSPLKNAPDDDEDDEEIFMGNNGHRA